MNQDPPPMPPDIDYRPPAQPEGMSTGAKWGVGCGIGCLATLLIVGVAGYFAWGKLKDFGGAFRDLYTSETPIAFEAPVADPSEVSALVARFDAFRDALASGGETGPLELTGEEINLLIYNHPDWKDLAGRTRVGIEEDRFTGEISIPISGLGTYFEGRYLNGMATIRLVLSNGMLEGYIEDIEVAGQSPPAELLTQLKAENIFKNSQSDPQFRDMMKNLESLRIEGGHLIIVPKPASQRQPAGTPSPGGTPATPEAPVDAALPVPAR